MEDSSAVLMESLKVCWTEAVLGRGCLPMERVWCYGILAVCTVSEFTETLKVFSCRFVGSHNVGGVTSARRCHSFSVPAVLEYFVEQEQAGRTGRNNTCFD